MKRAIALMLVLGFLIPSVTLAASKSSYTEKLYNRLWNTADLVVDGVITTINHKDKTSSVKILGAYKDEYEDISKLSGYYDIATPKGVDMHHKILLFLKRDKKGNYVQAIRDNKKSCIVYKAADYEYVSNLFPENHKYAEEYLTGINNQTKTYQYSAAIEDYFASHKSSLGYRYYDEHGYYNIVLTKKAILNKVKQDIGRLTDNSELIIISVEDRPSQYEMNDLSDKLLEKYDKLDTEQKLQLNVVTWGYNPTTIKIEIKIINLDKEKAALFRKWVSNSPYVDLIHTDLMGVPKD